MSKRVKSVNFFETTAKSIAVIAGLTVIKDVVIVQSGIDKVGDYMDDVFINAISEQGNKANTGIKCRGGHPNMCKDSLGTYIGDYHNFRSVEQDGKLKAVADLYIAEIAKKTQIDGKGISYHDYVVDMAKNHPDKFGNSIVFSADVEYMEVEGKEVPKLILENFIASDIVDSPAATDGLFKSDEDLGIKLTEFLDDNPEIFTSLEKNENAIDIFFKKYKNHLSNKQNKSKIMSSLTDKIKSALGITFSKNIDVTDATGKILTVVTEANDPMVGDEVQIDGAAAPDGEYLFPDGSKWNIVGGKIESITPAVAEPAPDETIVEEVKSLQNELKALKEEMNSLKSTFTETQKDTEEALVTFAKSVKSEYVPKQRQPEGKNEVPKSRREKQVGEILKSKK